MQEMKQVLNETCSLPQLDGNALDISSDDEPLSKRSRRSIKKSRKSVVVQPCNTEPQPSTSSLGVSSPQPNQSTPELSSNQVACNTCGKVLLKVSLARHQKGKVCQRLKKSQPAPKTSAATVAQVKWP